MSSLEDLEDLEQAREQREDDKDKKRKGDKDGKGGDKDGDAEMQDAEEDKEEDGIDPEVLNSSTQDIITRKRLLENDIRVMRQEYQRLQHEKTAMGKRIEDNLEKIDNNRFVILEWRGSGNMVY